MWVVRNGQGEIMMTVYELHARMTKHLFPSFASQDERFLTLALCGEAGELANMIKKRWRDGVDLADEIREEIADIRVYLELIAKRFGIEGIKMDAYFATRIDVDFNFSVDTVGYLNIESFLSLALCATTGSIAGMIEKRWLGEFVLESRICDEIVATRVRLEQIAKCFDIEGIKLDMEVEKKLVKVVQKHKHRLE